MKRIQSKGTARAQWPRQTRIKWGRLPPFLVGRFTPDQNWRAANNAWLGVWGTDEFYDDWTFFVARPLAENLTPSVRDQIRAFCREYDLVVFSEAPVCPPADPGRVHMEFVTRARLEWEKEELRLRAQFYVSDEQDEQDEREK